jgi:hypothetical protein
MQLVYFFNCPSWLDAIGLFSSFSIPGWLQANWSIFVSVHPWLDAMKMLQNLLVTGGVMIYTGLMRRSRESNPGPPALQANTLCKEPFERRY